LRLFNINMQIANGAAGIGERATDGAAWILRASVDQ
jgi:hypothetical protein